MAQQNRKSHTGNTNSKVYNPGVRPHDTSATIKRQYKRRLSGLVHHEEVELDEGKLPVTKEDPLVVLWEKAVSKDYPEQGIMGHMNLSVAQSIYRFPMQGLAEKLAKAGTGKRIKAGKIYLEWSKHNAKMMKESKDEDNDDKKKVGKKGKKDEIDTEPKMDDQKMTAEMSDKQMKKREEIVKSMKKKSGDFKKRYGDRAKDVMYATATKMATKEGFELGIEKSEFIEEVELDEIARSMTPMKDRFGKRPHAAGDVVNHRGKKVTLVKRNDRNGQERWETNKGGFVYASDLDGKD